MSKALHRIIMVRAKLKIKYNKNRTGESWDSYNKTKKLLCKTTKEN